MSTPQEFRFDPNASDALTDTSVVACAPQALGDAAPAWEARTVAQLRTQLLAEPMTATAEITTLASAAAGAGLNLPHGDAPTSPADGDMWTTTAGLFVRINGVTKTVTLT